MLALVGSTAARHVVSHHPTAMAKVANTARKQPIRAAPLSVSITQLSHSVNESNTTGLEPEAYMMEHAGPLPSMLDEDSIGLTGKAKRR
jgi:hypothetical protein